MVDCSMNGRMPPWTEYVFEVAVVRRVHEGGNMAHVPS